jgi:Fic family protein
MTDFSTMKSDKEKAIFLAKRQLPELVCDAVNLEGINYTVPEVQTLLEGVTVGGHKLQDEKITLNQANAWKLLFAMLKDNRFTLSKETACELHAVAGEEESLKWGCFREGGVTIAGTDYQPPAAKQLDSLWDEMLTETNTIGDVYDQAIFVFLQMARNQFFYDVNKRMGRFMMNAMLLNAGYPAVNLPAKKQTEFNRLMLDFYASNDVESMTLFMRGCLDARVIAIMSE